MVDATRRGAGEGYAFGYIDQTVFESDDDEDIKRMIREYNPLYEMVVVVLKPDNRTSTYRVSAQLRRS